MTGHDQSRGWDDVHALVGAYAVDALDAAERERFEAHLGNCADCRDEVDSLREAAAVLGSGDVVAPPPALREQVLAGISEIRPLPPLTAETPGGAPVDLAEARRRSRRVRPGRAGRLPLLVAAAAVVLLATVGGLVLRPWAGDEERVEPRLTVAEQVLGADDATRLEKRFPDGSQATIVHSREVGRAVILTKNMAPAPDGKDYELWLQTPAGELIKAGLMPDIRNATVLLDGDASRATGVGITVEPAGGSDQPTSDPIAFFTLET